MDLIDQIECELGKNADELANLRPGMEVQVHYLIREGEKERVQIFAGTIISMQGRGIRRNIIVRRIVQGEGVERTFPLHSPRVRDVVITRHGDVRRAKLYYLRERVGKATRVKERLGDKVRAERLAERERRTRQDEAAAAAAAAPAEDAAE